MYNKRYRRRSYTNHTQTRLAVEFGSNLGFCLTSRVTIDDKIKPFAVADHDESAVKPVVAKPAFSKRRVERIAS